MAFVQGGVMSTQSKAMYWQARAMELEAMAAKLNQAILALRFGSLEANFKQCTQTDEEIMDDALNAYAAMKGGKTWK